MILSKVTWRHYSKHPWQVLLAIFGITLGVAVYIAVDLVNSSTQKAFELSSKAIAGEASHTIIGGPSGVPEEVLAQLRNELALVRVAPMVEGYGRLVSTRDSQRRVFQVIGVDPFSELPFRQYLQATTTELDLNSFLTTDNGVLLAESAAKKMGLKPGSEFSLQIGGQQRQLLVLGLIDESRLTDKNIHSMIFTDISTAQELLDLKGHITKIDLILDEDRRLNYQVNLIKRILPSGTSIQTTESRQYAMAQMTEAFETNLAALSLMALIVGVFLIYNTMTFSVLQRREIFGVLRAVGATRIQVFRIVFVETLIIGVMATTFGIVMGMLIAHSLLNLVTQTINDLYFVLTVQTLHVSTGTIAKGFLMGVLATVIAGVAPALESAHATPRSSLTRSTLELKFRNLLKWTSLGGGALLLLGAFILFYPSRSLGLSFTGLFTVIVGFTFLVPQLTMSIIHFAVPLFARLFGSLGNIAARSVANSLSRTGIAIASLSVAIATAIGVAIMIDSFRYSVVDWLNSTVNADVVVTAAGVTSSSGKGTLDANWIKVFKTIPEVAHVSTTRAVNIQTPKGVTNLNVVDIIKEEFLNFSVVQGDANKAGEVFFREDVVLVSEPYAYHRNLNLYDMLVLPTDSGLKSFKIVGIYTDYGSEQGIVTMHRRAYARHWQDKSISAINVYGQKGVDPDLLVDIIHATVARERTAVIKHVANQDLVIKSNYELRKSTIDIFDRTFVVTEVLRMLAIFVAFVGVASALMAIQFERKAEVALLRALGLTPRQVWYVISGETGLIGFISGLLALPLGLLMAFLLILVINRRSFGWTMDISIDPFIFLQSVLLAVMAALVAGMFPAMQMSKSNTATALRED